MTAPGDANAATSGSPADPPSPLGRIESSNSANFSQERRSSATGRVRRASMRFMESSPPLGFMAATGEAIAKAPTLTELQTGRYGSRPTGRRSSSGKDLSSSATNRAQDGRPQSSSPISAGGAPQLPNFPSSSDPDKNSVQQGGNVADIQEGGEMVDQNYRKSTITQVHGGGASTASELGADGAPSARISEQANANLPYEDGGDDLFREPKRNSKNVKELLGEEPSSSSMEAPVEENKPAPNEQGYYPNGYHFPAKHTKGQATVIGIKAFWKFFCTPLGFFIVIYGLNVVAWGGMLFLLLCNASAQMCYVNGVKDCNDINAPRRIWLEIDSQILNALFCVTGFGLIPWRFRDFYFLLRFRFFHDQEALRRLAGYHNGWFRLEGSDHLPVPPPGITDPAYNVSADDSRLPVPVTSAPKPPLTGVRAPPTALWKMDYVVDLFVANTVLQAVLSGFMWGYNRYARPSWSTGLFVALGCIVAIMAGLMQFNEGKKVKNIEGIPLDAAETLREQTMGVEHTGPGQVAVGTLASQEKDAEAEIARTSAPEITKIG